MNCAQEYAGGVTKIANVQALRGAAALAVIGYHAAERTGVDFDIGSAGVELFFVISGFIMASAVARPKGFLLRRALRIFPLYWVIMGGSLVATLAFPGLSASAPDVMRSMLLLPVPSGERVLVVAWTLSHELFFYALLACLPRRRALVFASCAIIALTLLGLLSTGKSEIAGVITSPLNLCFVGGIMLAKLERQPHPGLACVVALACFAVLHLYSMPGNHPARALFYGVPALLLVYAGLGMRARMPVLEQFGDASYSLYLAQIPAMKALVLIFATVGFGAPGGVALAVFAVAVGCITHFMIERPLSRGARRLCEASERRPHTSLQRVFE